jgi:catalase
VALNLGIPAPVGAPSKSETASPALSQVVDAPGPIAGRVVGVVVADGVDSAGLSALRKALSAEGASVYVIAPTGGAVRGSRGSVAVDRSALTTQSVEYDCLVVAGGTSADAIGDDAYAAVNLGEAFRHHKTIGAWGAGAEVLDTLGMTDAPGVVTSVKVDAAFATDLIAAIGMHRHWARQPA